MTKKTFYRAKITRIFSLIESCYDLNKCTIVSDSKDAYLEVKSEEEAELIECIEKLQEQRDKAYLDLLQIVRWLLTAGGCAPST